MNRFADNGGGTPSGIAGTGLKAYDSSMVTT
jgi:hypothetical protein